MNKNTTARIIAEKVGSDHLADYLTAGHDMDLAVWADGSAQIVEHNRVWPLDSDEAPVARVQCPGIGNLDSTYFTEDFAAIDDNGEYIEISSGRKIGELDAVIKECCQDGDMIGHTEDLIDALVESVEPIKKKELQPAFLSF